MDVHLTCMILPAPVMLAQRVCSTFCVAAPSSVRISIACATLRPPCLSIDMSKHVHTMPPVLTMLVVTPVLWNSSMLGAIRSVGKSSSRWTGGPCTCLVGCPQGGSWSARRAWFVQTRSGLRTLRTRLSGDWGQHHGECRRKSIS
jgi:hypothetical protein